MPVFFHPPLFPLLLTRPTRSSLGFWSDLSEEAQNAFEPVISPLVDIVPIDQDAPFPTAEVTLFSSAHGVRFGPKGNGQRAYCVGDKTTKTATKLGWRAHCAGQSSDALVETLIRKPERPSVLHVSGQHTRGDIVGRLSDAGFRANHVIVYDQILRPLTPQAEEIIAKGTPVVAPLFSPRTAQHFAHLASHPAHIHVIAMSRAIAQSVAKTPFASVTIAEQPTAQAMRDAALSWLRTHQSG